MRREDKPSYTYIDNEVPTVGAGVGRHSVSIDPVLEIYQTEEVTEE